MNKLLFSLIASDYNYDKHLHICLLSEKFEPKKLRFRKALNWPIGRSCVSVNGDEAGHVEEDVKRLVSERLDLFAENNRFVHVLRRRLDKYDTKDGIIFSKTDCTV